MTCISCKKSIGIFLIGFLHWAGAVEGISAQNIRTVTLTSTSCEIEAYLAESVDRAPAFPGGDAAMMRFINSERQYPRDAYAEGIHGRVVCGVVIAPDGSISNISVVRGVESSLNAEAIRIISRMPKWEAGELGGQKVPVYCIVTIPFRL